MNTIPAQPNSWLVLESEDGVTASPIIGWMHDIRSGELFDTLNSWSPIALNGLFGIEAETDSILAIIVGRTIELSYEVSETSPSVLEREVTTITEAVSAYETTRASEEKV